MQPQGGGLERSGQLGQVDTQLETHETWVIFWWGWERVGQWQIPMTKSQCFLPFYFFKFFGLFIFGSAGSSLMPADFL